MRTPFVRAVTCWLDARCACSQEPDDEATVHIRQTVQRVGGQLVVDATKTRASSAIIPLPKITRTAILARRRAWADERKTAGECWQDHDLVFGAQIGTPLEPGR